MFLYSEKRKSCFFILLLSLSAFLLINNAYYGFGWTDEALYTATANSLYHGNRLFFDIFEPTQIYSVLVYPLFYIFVKLTGSTDYIYLFIEHIVNCNYRDVALHKFNNFGIIIVNTCDYNSVKTS